MNWEDSNACTPLKRDFLRLWFAQEQRFFLTGGSALGLFYLDHRRSYDLDLFTSDEVEGKELQNLVLRVAAGIGADCLIFDWMDLIPRSFRLGFYAPSLLGNYRPLFTASV